MNASTDETNTLNKTNTLPDTPKKKGKSLKFKVALVVLFLFTIYAYKINGATGTSMEPTMSDKCIYLSQSTYLPWTTIERGDIVGIYTRNNKKMKSLNVETNKLSKRVIGLPGETLKYDYGKIYIDGVLLKEPYIRDLEENRVEDPPMEVKLGKDEYFVMGDNRNGSLDSRILGPIKKHLIFSKVIYVIKNSPTLAPAPVE